MVQQIWKKKHYLGLNEMKQIEFWLKGPQSQWNEALPGTLTPVELVHPLHKNHTWKWAESRTWIENRLNTAREKSVSHDISRYIATCNSHVFKIIELPIILLTISLPWMNTPMRSLILYSSLQEWDREPTVQATAVTHVNRRGQLFSSSINYLFQSRWNFIHCACD